MNDLKQAARLVLAWAFLSASGLHARGQAPAFVDAAQAVPGLAVDMRYAGPDNFVGRRIDGYDAARCLLTREAAAALVLVQRVLAADGLGLKVFDCYRPARAVAHFVRWARDLGDEARKAAFYPQVEKRDLFRLGYIAAHSGHSRGSTVDLTLVRRSDGAELDMGTPFDFFSPRSGWAGPGVSATARANRARLRGAMQRGGFVPYAKEWWHFTLRPEPFPHQAFDVPVR